jgi:ketosteroid isomerase-like protein
VQEPTQRTAPEAQSGAAYNRKLVARAFSDWADGTGSVFDILSDDVLWTIPGSGPTAGAYKGRQAYIDAAVTPLMQRLIGPVIPRVSHIWAVEDRVIIQWDQETPARDGHPYRNTYVWIFTIEDEKVVEVTAFLDLPAYDDLVSRLSPVVEGQGGV